MQQKCLFILRTQSKNFHTYKNIKTIYSKSSISPFKFEFFYFIMNMVSPNKHVSILHSQINFMCYLSSKKHRHFPLPRVLKRRKLMFLELEIFFKRVCVFNVSTRNLFLIFGKYVQCPNWVHAS